MNTRWLATVMVLGLASCREDPTAEACDEDESPFFQPDCVSAVDQACGELTDPQACAARTPWSFASGDYVIQCGWLKVVDFPQADGLACEPSAVRGACFATFDRGDGLCSDACPAGPSTDEEQLEARGSSLVQSRCLVGPIGPGSSCLAEDPPPLCACAEAACGAETP